MSDDLLSRLRLASTDEDRALIITEDLISTLSPSLQSMVWAAAVPRWFNTKILTALRPELADQAEALYQELQDLSFVEVFPERGHNVHERTRQLMLNHLFHERQEEFRNLTDRAKDFFDLQVEPENYGESLYHAQLYDFDDIENSFLQMHQDSLFQYAEKSLTELLPEHLYNRLAFVMSGIRKNKDDKSLTDLMQRFVKLASESNSLPELVIAAGLDPLEDFVNADLSGTSLTGVDLSGYNLNGANLSGANLKGAFLSRANLSGANLSGARLDRANLSGAILNAATLNHARLTCANLRVAKLKGAEMEGALLDGADLRGADLTGANLHHARLGRVDFRGSQLSGANLSTANLRCADLRNAYMRGANLTQAKLDGADLSNTNLAEANLSHVSMQRAHGDGCNLSGAVLKTTDLRNANFSAADFSSARFEDTQFDNMLLTGAWFMGSQGLPEERQEYLVRQGAIVSESMVSDVGFTQADIDSRIVDLEECLTKLEEWIDTLRIRVGQDQSWQDVQLIENLVAEFQQSCVGARQNIYSYQSGLGKMAQTPEESAKEYANINEQIVKVGNFIRVVQIILIDVPGFIQRSS